MKKIQPIWYIIILAAIILIPVLKIPLFAVYSPDVPSSTLTNYINKYYYDTAIYSGSSWACPTQASQVVLRTTFPLTQATLPTTSDQIAIYNGNADLVRFRGSTGLTSQSGSCAAYVANPQHPGSILYQSPDLSTLKIITYNGIYAVCLDTSPTHSRREFTATSGLTISTSPDVQGGNEVIHSTDIRDEGKFTCLNGNVVTQYCGAFGTTTPDPLCGETGCTCGTDGCEVVEHQIGGVNKLVAKCGDNGKTFKANQLICSDDKTKLYATGTYTGLPSNLPYTDCTANNGYECQNSKCLECKEGASICTADNKDRKVCVNGAYVLDEATYGCPGDKTCSMSGARPDYVSVCVSNYQENQPRCNDTTPEIYHNGYWVADTASVTGGQPCRTECSSTGVVGTHATCTDEEGCIDGTYKKCNSQLGATLQKCDPSNLGNKWINYYSTGDSQCYSQACKSTTECAPVANIQIDWEYCNGKNRQNTMLSSDLLTGGVILNPTILQTCNIACNETTTIPQTTFCRKISDCIGKSGQSICKPGSNIILATCNQAEDAFSVEEDCTNRGTNYRCEDNACTQITPECESTYGCNPETNTMYNCNSGYFTTAVPDACNGQGCTKTGTALSSNTNSQCNNQCTAAGTVCTSGHIKDCTEKTVTDQDSKQFILENDRTCTMLSCADSTKCTPIKPLGTYCNGKVLREVVENLTRVTDGLVSDNFVKTCANDCALVNGVYGCVDECTGNYECLNGAIYTCSDGVRSSPYIYTCEGSCYTKSNGDGACMDLCSAGVKTCLNGDSYICQKNETTQSYTYELSQDCGTDSCSSGQCQFSAAANSAYCVGNYLYLTDENRIGTFSTDCGAKADSSTGLSAECVPGVRYCKYCTQGTSFCGDNNLYVCGNEQTGEASATTQCNAGCKVIEGNKYCDQLNAVVNPIQVFAIGAPVDVVGIFKGSKSGLGLPVTCTGTLTIAGTPTTNPCSVGTDGKVTVSFGVQPAGTYTGKLIVTGTYAGEYPFTVKVTNSYIIKLASASNVFFKIPGTTSTSASVSALDSSGNGAGAIHVKSITPTGLTAVPSAGTQGMFSIALSGEPGIYTINLAPVDALGTELDTQSISVQFSKPSLKIVTNMPTSTSSTGQKTYDITVSGATSSQATENIEPTSITATINSQAITLKNFGTGKRTFDYDFKTAGTYTLNAEATLEGYDNGELTSNMAVGNVVIGNNTCAAGYVSCNGICQTSCPITPDSNLLTYILIGIVIYLIVTRKKGRKR